MIQILLRRKSMVVLAPGEGQTPTTVIATIQRNLAAFGYGLAPDLEEQVATLGPDGATEFYRRLERELKVMLGAHRVFKPLYPGFPGQVMALSEGELYLNALRHYWGLVDEFPDEEHRAPSKEQPKLRRIRLGTRADLEAVFARLAQARTPYSPQDREDVARFIVQYGQSITRLLPATVGCKENLAVLVGTMLREGIDPSALDASVRTATDVLRIAVGMANGDVSLAEPAKFGRMPRAVRARLLGWLERTGSRLEDMQRWEGRWIRLGERLHPGEFAKRFPLTADAFSALRNGRRERGFNSRVEAALAKPTNPWCPPAWNSKGLEEALEILRTRPGELARRLDVLLRRGGGRDVLEAFACVAPKVSTPVLFQVLMHFRHRDKPGLRVFFPKGQLANVFARSDVLPPIAHGIAADVVALCDRTLAARFETLAPLGRCYLDPALTRYLAPFSQRSAAKALRTIVRGSRVAFGDVPTLRFFTWWRNGRGRVDIDLSAAMYSGDFRYIDTLAYYNLRNYGAVHSGDIVDAPQGASEFIDIDVERCRKLGVRYVVACISNYTRQPFCDLPECYAGWMARHHPDSGEPYDPATVVDRFDVSSATEFCLPMVFDLEARQMIWADIAVATYPRWQNNVHNNLAGVSLMVRALTHLRKLDLHTLFELHIRARGTQVERPEDADTVFAEHHGITPKDLDRISAEYL
jgi:hypothetical protein